MRSCSSHPYLPLRAEKRPIDYVNPFLGTAPLTDPADIGFKPPWRVWAGLVFPGASVPNAMVQLSPITKFGSGAGYEYENHLIHAFAHINKGHWNLCYIPVLPVSGPVTPDDFGSTFCHAREPTHPSYYQVYLERYHVNAELTTTLRTGFHRCQDRSIPAAFSPNLLALSAITYAQICTSLRLSSRIIGLLYSQTFGCFDAAVASDDSVSYYLCISAGKCAIFSALEEGAFCASSNITQRSPIGK